MRRAVCPERVGSRLSETAKSQKGGSNRRKRVNLSHSRKVALAISLK